MSTDLNEPPLRESEVAKFGKTMAWLVGILTTVITVTAIVTKSGTATAAEVAQLRNDMQRTDSAIREDLAQNYVRNGKMVERNEFLDALANINRRFDDPKISNEAERRFRTLEERVDKLPPRH